ncbi:MAG TPA: tetratricopeptide repeat protein, partial [Phycisphaerae bacterium]|nr:tetratricopeptide repeat protein [Phycisphaerae bacterium]
MTQLSVHDALQLALRHQHAGNLKDAEQIYRQILQVYPDQPDALHLLGMIAYQASAAGGGGGSALAEAEGLVRRAIALSPQPAFTLTLGGILLNAKRPDEAIQLYRDLLAANPTLPEAHTHLGIALCVARRHDEAIAPLEQSLQLDPNNPYTQGNLGIALTHVNRLDDAIKHLQSATTALPLNGDFHSALATALNRAGKYEDAITAATRATQLAPNRGEPHHTLSIALARQNKIADALPHAKRAAELLPEIADVQSVLAELLRQIGKPDEAIALYRTVLEKQPNAAELRTNLGTLLLEQSLHDEALAELRRALTSAPKRSDIHSALLHALLFHPTLDIPTLLNEHRDFHRRHADSLTPRNPTYSNSREPQKILRIAYLSSEFRAHPIGMLLLPLLQHHDKAEVESFCYSDTRNPDALTTHLQKSADYWRDSRNLTDAQLADLIRTDHIDILIDLHQHSPPPHGNRLLTFARKPA